MKVFLLGMPGSGKSKMGKALADEIGLPFVDLDQEIERAESRKIAEIFSSDGEAYFREKETKTLVDWIEGNDDFIMATGGGTPCFHDNMERMNRAGATVFIDVPIGVLAGRMKHSERKLRPLLKAGSDLPALLESLRKERQMFYSRAILTIDEKTEVGELLALLRTKG